MTSKIAKRLATHWGREGNPPGHGASPEAVSAFESSHKVVIPAEMRDYLLELDGMGQYWPDDQDANGFSLWPIARIRPVAEELAALGKNSIPGLEHYFAFADYMAWSWAYAILLTHEESSDNPVVIIGMDSPVRVASSFGEFVDLYLEDSPRLYGPVQ